MKNSLETVATCLLFLAVTLLNGFAPVAAQDQSPAPDLNTCSIAGSITIDGKPRAGIVVELLQTTPKNSRRGFVTKVTTGKTGGYIIRGIPPGSYDISPSAPSAAVPNEGSFSQSGKSVMVDAGENIKGVDFKLVTTGSISGRVTDVDGKPVAGETVSLIIPNEHGFSRQFVPGESANLQTDDTGSYHISSVPPGRYLVRIGIYYGVPQFSSGDKERPYYPQTFHPNTTEQSEAAVVDVKTGKESTDVDINVDRPLKTYEIAGQVIDIVTAAPISNVGLGLITRSDNGRSSNEIGGALSSDSNGQFKIRAALPGHYVVYPENETSRNLYGDRVEFDLKAQDLTGLRIKMHHASTVSGIVAFEGSGGPLAADQIAKLGLFPIYQSRNESSGGRPSEIGADGQFRITGVQPGTVVLSLDTHLADVPEGFKVLRVERYGVPLSDGFEVQPDQDVNDLRVVLGSGNCVLRGHVKIEGGPLEGLHLYVSYRPTNGDPHSYFRANLDARSRFAVGGLMPGEYELTIGPMSVEMNGPAGSGTMSRMPTVKHTVSLVPGAALEVELVLSLTPKP